MNEAREFIRSMVRPVATLTFVGATAGAALTGNFDAVEALAPLTGVVVTFWFVTRKPSDDA